MYHILNYCWYIQAIDTCTPKTFGPLQLVPFVVLHDQIAYLRMHMYTYMYTSQVQIAYSMARTNNSLLMNDTDSGITYVRSLNKQSTTDIHPINGPEICILHQPWAKLMHIMVLF